MEALLERIEENKLDALYLFINETLRDRNEFERFYANLLQVLPHNWSIQRVEVGHEFLTQMNTNRIDREQTDLFELICGLESLRTLIISDGYVPRKDNGSVQTDSLLSSLPRARNLINLDLQRLNLQTNHQVELLTECFESLQESLEDLRITGLVLGDQVTCNGLDQPMDQCAQMQNLRSLAMSCASNSNSNRNSNTDNTDNSNSTSSSSSSSNNNQRVIVSRDCLLRLCQKSTTLQDLSLRHMHLDDETCKTLATALQNNSFLTSLDIRQNEGIGNPGYASILDALERNYDLWCTVMVDNESFQAKFNSLIELNQANRGDLVRSPTREKLAAFIEKLQEGSSGSGGDGDTGTGTGDPTSLWYFLSIHDTILFPFVHFVQWKLHHEKEKKNKEDKKMKEQQQQVQGEQQQQVGNNYNNKRPAIIAEGTTTFTEQQQQQQPPLPLPLPLPQVDNSTNKRARIQQQPPPPPPQQQQHPPSTNTTNNGTLIPPE